MKSDILFSDLTVYPVELVNAKKDTAGSIRCRPAGERAARARGKSAAVSYAGGRDGPEERAAASAGRERVAGMGEAAGASVAGKSRCPAERRLPVWKSKY